MKKILLILIAILLILCSWLGYQNYSKSQDLEDWASNYKTLSLSRQNIENECHVYKFKVDQLDYYTDSLIKSMDSVRKELGIKDKQLQQLAYLKQNITKKDTIYVPYTIFVEDLKMDTTIGDQWYQLHLDLTYPNSICIEPNFVSDTYINTYSYKETINKPRKFFLFRWFQKKHTVTKVTIVEKNPYIKTEEKVFIDIIE